MKNATYVITIKNCEYSQEITQAEYNKLKEDGYLDIHGWELYTSKAKSDQRREELVDCYNREHKMFLSSGFAKKARIAKSLLKIAAKYTS